MKAKADLPFCMFHYKSMQVRKVTDMWTVRSCRLSPLAARAAVLLVLFCFRQLNLGGHSRARPLARRLPGHARGGGHGSAVRPPSRLLCAASSVNRTAAKSCSVPTAHIHTMPVASHIPINACTQLDEGHDNSSRARRNNMAERNKKVT